jgi:hypothetical protein
MKRTSRICLYLFAILSLIAHLFFTDCAVSRVVSAFSSICLFISAHAAAEILEMSSSPSEYKTNKTISNKENWPEHEYSS